MTRRKTIDKKLDEDAKKELLEKLEKIGQEQIKEYMDEILSPLNSPLNQQDKNDQEFLSRYLLLVAILDQQAEAESAVSTVHEIYRQYGRSFFMEPLKSIDNLDNVIKLVKSVYKPKTRVLRMKKTSIILMRVGGYLLALLSIERKDISKSLVNFLKKSGNPRKMLREILDDNYLGGLLYEKAARMYVGWVTHPHLPVKVLENVDVRDIPMVVDGHVAKVFARTGFLEEALVEDEKDIIEAEKEREIIETKVRKYYPEGDFFMIDYGAFYVGIKFCHEDNPQCDLCPLNRICGRNKEIRAY